MAEQFCKVCGGSTRIAFTTRVLNKYDAVYIQCKKCSFLYAEDPIWLSEAYKSAINLSDTGLVSRNIYFSKVASVLLYYFFDSKDIFLDYAGGYGLFTRLMRDVGFNFYWEDPHCENIFSKGFEYHEAFGKPAVITAFEVFEHLPDPGDINKLLSRSKNVLFSTELLPLQLPDPDQWWYYGFEHGQHIAFYSADTLRQIADNAGAEFYSLGGIHLFSERKLNPILLKLAAKLYRFGLYLKVKKSMKSKTQGDHLILKYFEGEN